MNLAIIELGIRKFRIPEPNAQLIHTIVDEYSASGMGQLIITRHLLKFDVDDLTVFHDWMRSGKSRVSIPICNGDFCNQWDEKFQKIAHEVTCESRLAIPPQCQC